MNSAFNNRKLVYLSPLPWSSFAQRPHFLARKFLELNRRQVLWIDPYPGRLPRLEDLARLRAATGTSSNDFPSTRSGNAIRVIKPPALPIEPFRGLSILNHLLWKRVIQEVRTFTRHDSWTLGIGRPSELAQRLMTDLQPDASFYDAMDDFPEFYRNLSRQALLKRERQIAEQVDRIYVSSTNLEEKFAAISPNVVRLPNACDISSLPEPEMRTHIPVVFGYVGTISHWFDWDIIRVISQDWPDASISLIGPIYGKRPRDLAENVQLAGSCRHNEVGARLQTFSVGLIPFKQNALTRSVDPIKYYEYRSMGLPVLTTAFGEMNRHVTDEGVFMFDKRERGASAVAGALAFRDSSVNIQRFRKENTWSERFSGIIGSHEKQPAEDEPDRSA